ncbi:uncharacterized protein ACMZJ9_012855 [Mantella aurantiaca]
MADIQQMFHCFIVREDNRNFLRFRWYRNNDVSNEVIDYRMKVHVFGNSPSPAVAIYGLRKTAKEGEEEFGTDARQFVERNFYVDDGLKSLPTEEEAIDLLTRTQNMLATANLRLHKIISNSNEGQCHLGFVMGQAKLVPLPEHTKPRLELCAAVLAVELAELITTELNIEITEAEFYTDSKVVLGYIFNKTRHFYVYINNRVLRISRSTYPKQWHFVSTDHNPADHATRSVAASSLMNMTWLTGPASLSSISKLQPMYHNLQAPTLKEVSRKRRRKWWREKQGPKAHTKAEGHHQEAGQGDIHAMQNLTN